MKIPIKLDTGAIMPKHGHDTDAGYDLCTPEKIIIKKNDSALIDTGVHMAIPKGYYGKIESKSGLNVKHSIVSCGGVIDSGYTGTITVKLYNMGNSHYIFGPGDKVAQIVIAKCEYPTFEVVDGLKGTERGDNGFGSTGR